MASAEILARLAAGTVDHARVSGSDHGGITQSDIAAAMSGMTKFSESILRAKYAGQAEFLAVLRRDLADLVQRTGMTEKWPRMTAEWLDGLLDCVIEDNMGAGRCPSCLGCGRDRRAMEDVTAIKICYACKGTGREDGKSLRSIARVIGMDEDTFRNRFRVMVSEVRYVLLGAETAGLSVIRRKLKR
jgi:hypothetical protein